MRYIHDPKHLFSAIAAHFARPAIAVVNQFLEETGCDSRKFYRLISGIGDSSNIRA